MRLGLIIKIYWTLRSQASVC